MTPHKIRAFDHKAIGLTDDEYEQLKKLALNHKGHAWDTSTQSSPLNKEEKSLVTKFKKKLKDHLYSIGQGRYCCYCGIELHSHKATYDLEHVIAKDDRGNVVFHLKNLSLSCKPCNTNKSCKGVTTSPSDANRVWQSSNKYILVHPHLDNWTDHLHLDEFSRVKSKIGNISSKANNTIKICKIELLNIARLADYFSINKNKKSWGRFYASFYSGNKTDLNKKIAFLNLLADSGTDPAATKIRDLLLEELS